MWVAGSDRGDADVKRMGTLHILIQCAPVGTRQPKPLLIFRGKGIRIPTRERQNWHPDVDVMFQPKAWVDANLAQQWVLKCANQYLHTNKKNLVFMDNLNAQINQTFVKLMAKVCNAYCYYFVSGCTDIQQPIDQGVGAIVKKYMGEELDAWLMSPENLERWVKPGGMSAGDRRILMTKWVAQAWGRMCCTFDFQRLFEKTGCLMSANGCNVNFVGCPGYKFTPRLNNNTVPTDPNTSDFTEEDVDCDDDDECVSEVSGYERESDDSGNERLDDDAESDTASENDDVADGGPFVLTSCTTWKTIVDVMTQEFRATMATQRVMIAHKFDFTGWDIGQVIGIQASGKHRGSYVVQYESDSKRYLHQLNMEDYGPSKIWVALAKR